MALAACYEQFARRPSTHFTNTMASLGMCCIYYSRNDYSYVIFMEKKSLPSCFEIIILAIGHHHRRAKICQINIQKQKFMDSNPVAAYIMITVTPVC